MIKDIELFKKLYPVMRTAEVAKLLNASVDSCYNLAYRLKLRKDHSTISETLREIANSKNHGGIKTRFKKGHKPHNKGKDMQSWMSEQGIEKSKKTRFKKGHKPHNTKKVGYKVLRGDGYLYIKVEGLTKLVPKNRWLWEQHKGSIPKGYNVQFKDGNRLNCSIENLYLISRSEQLKKENSLCAKYPEDVQALIRLKGVLNRTIKKQKENEQ